ncbi:MAG TPA: hypothetical protein PKG48_10075, partial [Bacteroidales bacterium]|nr:hypothetical protein [Bacteroidales bacterium]
MRTTLTLLLFLAVQALQAHIWRVNNNPGVNASFVNFTAAQNAAANGDTLYFEGSSTSYGNITVTKPLVIIGPGYLLTENPQTQANPIPAKFGSIALNTGSSGSVVAGLEISSGVTIYVGNISVMRCHITGTGVVLNCSSSSYGNIFINGNYMYSGKVSNTGNTNLVYNVIISNNYLNDMYSSIALTSNFSGVISNNILEDDLGVSNFTIINNIQRNGDISLSNCVLFNNLCSGTQFPVGNGNQQNINMTDVFLGTNSTSTDGQWQLAIG